MDNTNNLSVSIEVLEQMAVMAALETTGVMGVVDRPVDIKTVFNKGKLFKPAVATEKNGAIAIDINIKVKEDALVKEVAEAVQTNVKEKLQNMTGSAITRVNVIVADISFEEK
jgi:uncharacterized alkaline shock family protein YloU